MFDEGVSECGMIFFEINVMWLSSECLSVFLNFFNMFLKFNDGNLMFFSMVFFIVFSKLLFNVSIL